MAIHHSKEYTYLEDRRIVDDLRDEHMLLKQPLNECCMQQKHRRSLRQEHILLKLLEQHKHRLAQKDVL